MPQTKFVLRKALELNLKPVVVVNKIDRHDARPHDVIDEVFDLFLELGASEEQLDFPIVYTSARSALAKYEIEEESDNLVPLFEMIVREVAPPLDGDHTLHPDIVAAARVLDRLDPAELLKTT